MRYRHLFENSRLAVKTMPGDDLVRYITHSEDENHDVFDRIKYLFPSEMHREIHIVHLDGKRIVSNLALQENPYDDSEYWLKHVSVDEDYRNRGLATELYQKAVELARKNGKAIKRSSSSDMGQKYLSHVVDRIKQDNPDVEIRNSDKY